MAEHGGSLLDGLPFWAQIAANLGMFVVAIVAAAFGFMRKLAAGSAISESHFEAGGSLHKTGSDIRELTDAVVRLADAAESAVRIMQTQERQEDIDREVEHRLKEFKAKGR